MKISKKEFEAYEAVRVSGVTNMWDTRTVSRLSGLSSKKILYIMEHYRGLMVTYPEVRSAKRELKRLLR